MWWFSHDLVSAYLLVVAILTLLVAVLVWQRNRTGKTAAIWLSSALLGVLLGGIGSYALVRLSGYLVVEGVVDAQGNMGPAGVGMATPNVGMGGGPGLPSSGGGPDMGTGGPSMGGMGMGGMGGGMGMGGFGQPRPKRDLTTLVRKIELLTGDVVLNLTPDQTVSLVAALEDIEQAESMTDEEAQAKHDAILAQLDDAQKARLEAIGLPRGAPRGQGGGSPGGPGSPAPDENANPFQEEANAKALDALRQRFAAAGEPAPSAPADEPAEPAATETPVEPAGEMPEEPASAPADDAATAPPQE